ncbi:glucan biosynthesis protein [Pseudooceanicola sp. CBS1P-1]|uniref:Glucan biosynthesis protein D n=1 Tax=Pseudooceanicola albus TaxID=2692189 RepID=A0A6L7GAD1_9RHOB|nr:MULTISPECIES: glucan biosynthesis protein D [Pseudooceanicola]MBT9386287.1 glucan biosynthesis protein [Pseudooceanicola endophyticus]MXN20336.1 glucan biosynthesis protein D [Pseudooceanicola albus]
MMNRRTLLRSATLLAGGLMLPALPLRAQQAQDAAAPFSFDALIQRAKDMAQAPYEPPMMPDPEIVQQINYQRHGELKFHTATARFSGQPDTGDVKGYPLEFFPLGMYAPKRVRMFVVENGQSSEVHYNPALFDMPADNPARKLPSDAGFAGFRLQEWYTEDDWTKQDWVAFQGASYFRAIGADGQYGLSARGIVINAAIPDGPEEFPDFKEFYIEQQPGGTPDSPVTVHALLDGPSVTGAYRIKMTRGLDRTKGVIMEVEAKVFLREDVERLGLMPMTSMFWFSEYGRDRLIDWRPEVHDSDGLSMWSGTGERIWRPLNNPDATRVAAFGDENPRGFGLSQRDRNFDHYQDGVFYDRRPSLWVEPLAPLGKGAVQLMEIPTDDEINDNIGAFWVPEAPSVKGNSYDLHYRLYWQNTEPFPATNIAQTRATRIGRGGQPGHPRPAGVYHFAVEFDRPEVMKQIPYGVFPDVMVTASNGTVSRTFAEPVPNGNIWRANFDLALEEGQLTDLRMYMALDGKPLTETWLYQFRSDWAFD